MIFLIGLILLVLSLLKVVNLGVLAVAVMIIGLVIGTAGAVHKDTMARQRRRDFWNGKR